ncbi:vitelline membrane outer layer protein 1 homolog [Mytilus californianus]|uniref:vitelline membrane outer layer protein 1 homolog n=1 Tax=Mytilus californianus TaxID=6549 RepID=UPI0022479E4B|nr:vitelline membrane outer layer protein 1 homolog [Mytilus californianus]
MLCYIDICLFVSVLLTAGNGPTDVEAQIKSKVAASTKAAQRILKEVLSVANGGTWGPWSGPEFCAEGYYATGYSLKIEEKQGKGDDTALNAIRLKCRKGNNSPSTGGTISAQEGRWGQWSETTDCPLGEQLVGFRLQVEAKQGRGDDTAANTVNFRCRSFNGGATNIIGTRGFWGKVGAWSQTCPLGSAICGLEVRIEPNQGRGDDTALNDAKFYCCSQ